MQLVDQVVVLDMCFKNKSLFFTPRLMFSNIFISVNYDNVPLIVNENSQFKIKILDQYCCCFLQKHDLIEKYL